MEILIFTGKLLRALMLHTLRSVEILLRYTKELCTEAYFEYYSCGYQIGTINSYYNHPLPASSNDTKILIYGI